MDLQDLVNSMAEENKSSETPETNEASKKKPSLGIKKSYLLVDRPCYSCVVEVG